MDAVVRMHQELARATGGMALTPSHVDHRSRT